MTRNTFNFGSYYQNKKTGRSLIDIKALRFFVMALLITTALTMPINAVADDSSERAKKSQNPISTMISVPFENNANFNSGSHNKVLNVFNIKPVVPASIGNDWNLINRAIVPIISQPGVDGALVSKIWDITDNKSDDDISMMTFQSFANYNFDKGWYVSFAPVMTANWEAKGSDQWTIPLGDGVGRVVRIGKQAINCLVIMALMNNADEPYSNFMY